MSVYRQNSQQDGDEEMEEENGKGTTENGEEVEQTDKDVNEQWNRNRALVMQQNRHRQQLAAHLQIALPSSSTYDDSSSTKKEKQHPRVSRKALKRHNTATTSRLAVKRQVQKCSFKAGRRRC